MDQSAVMSQRPVSPIHVHVDNATPVHVHVKKLEKARRCVNSKPVKSKKSTVASGGRGCSEPCCLPCCDQCCHDPCHNPCPTPPCSQRTTFKSRPKRSKSRSPQHSGPWIPPPGKSSRGIQGGALEMDSDSEERMASTLYQYQAKVGLLMSEVDELKSQLDQKSAELCKVTEKHNENRREHELERLICELQNMSDSESTKLLMKLTEVDVDSLAVSSQIEMMSNSVKSRYKDPNELCRDREVLAEKMSKFQISNRVLRHLIKTQRQSLQDRDQLLNKIASMEGLLKAAECQVEVERREAANAWKILAEMEEKSEKDKSELRKSARLLKDRASQNDCSIESANHLVKEQEIIINKLTSELEKSRACYIKLADERCMAMEEITLLKNRLNELELVFEHAQSDSSREIEAMRSSLKEKVNDICALQDENEQLKNALLQTEERLHFTEKEMSQIQEIVHDYERQLAEYRNQIKYEVETQFQELEALPQLLKSTELKLSETAEQLELVQKQNKNDQERIQELKMELETLKRDSLFSAHAKDQKQLEFEAMLCENLTLQQKLAMSEKEKHQSVERERDKYSSKDRAMQARIEDMECQLNKSRSELTTLRREKEEAERKLKNQLFDIKDRLDKSHETNVSMQSYVQHLKNSYCEVFNDTLLSPNNVNSSYVKRF